MLYREVFWTMDISITDFNRHLKKTQILNLVPGKGQENKYLLKNYFPLIVLKKLLIYYKTFHSEKLIHLERLVIAMAKVLKDHTLGLEQYGAHMGSLLKPVRLLLDVIPQVYQFHLNAEVPFNPTVYGIKKKQDLVASLMKTVFHSA